MTIFLKTSMSLEEIMDKKDGIFKQIFHNIGVSFQKMLDNGHYYLTSFNLQKGRIAKLRRDIESSNSSTITITVKKSKYTSYGKDRHSVRTMDEYLKLYREVSDVMISLNEGLHDLADDDIFTTAVMIKEFLKGNSDGYFRDRFKALLQILAKVKQSAHLKLEAKKKTSTIYATDVMLGLAQVVATSPNADTYDFDDQISIVDATRHMYVYVERLVKVDASYVFTGSLDLEVTKKQALEILKINEQFLDSADKLISFITKLSTRLAGDQYGSLTIHMLRDSDNRDDAVLYLTRAGRITNRISAILYDSVASSYNFSMGNIKKSNDLVSKYVSKTS
jgi:hypothetical protein